MQKSGLRPVTAYCCHNSLGSLAAMPKGESATSPAPIRAELAREPPLPGVLQLSSPGQITHYTGLAGGQALIPQASFTCPHLPTKFCSSQEES